MVPKGDYFTCTDFTYLTEKRRGVRRLTLSGPDGHRPKVTLGIQLKRVVDRFIILFSVFAFAWGRVENEHETL